MTSFYSIELLEITEDEPNGQHVSWLHNNGLSESTLPRIGEGIKYAFQNFRILDIVHDIHSDDLFKDKYHTVRIYTKRY